MPLIYGEGKQNAHNRLLKELGARLSIALPFAEGASFDSYMQERNARCLRDTRTALLHHITTWVKDEITKPIFWLNGMAGTGKSTIARTIAHDFAIQQQLGASFFFKKGEGELGSASRVFTTIALGLITQVPEMKVGVKEALDEDPTIVGKSLKTQFEKLILRPLCQVSRHPRQDLVIVLDALDECDHDGDIREILRLLARVKEISSFNIRAFVTSRPELHIRLGFKEMSDGEYEHFILHEIAADVVKHDIMLFLQHELEIVRKQRSLPLSWPQASQIEALARLASPLFIFAATACRYIGDPRHNPRTCLDMMLNSQGKKTSRLDATYLPIMNLLFEEEDESDKGQWGTEFRTIVGSLVMLWSPVSINTLANLLGLSKVDVGCRLDSLHSVLSVPNNNDVPVRLLHLSFRDFLVDPQKRGKSPLWVDERQTHADLASRCIELMSGSGGLRPNLCKLRGPATSISTLKDKVIGRRLPSHLQYACRYWTIHVCHSQHTLQEGCPTHVFLDKHLLHWLEALSILREVSRATALLWQLHGATKV